MIEFKIEVKAILREDGLIYLAIAEKDKKEGQHIIWFESRYIEDALKGLDREIKRLIKENNQSPKNESESQTIATGGVGATPNTLDIHIKQELNKEISKDYPIKKKEERQGDGL